MSLDKRMCRKTVVAGSSKKSPHSQRRRLRQFNIEDRRRSGF